MAPFGGFFLWCASRLEVKIELLAGTYGLFLTLLYSFFFCGALYGAICLLEFFLELFVFVIKVAIKHPVLFFLSLIVIGLLGLNAECGQYQCLYSTGIQTIPSAPQMECEEKPLSFPEEPIINPSDCLSNLPWKNTRHGGRMLSYGEVRQCYEHASLKAQHCLLTEVEKNVVIYSQPRVYDFQASLCLKDNP